MKSIRNVVSINIHPLWSKLLTYCRDMSSNDVWFESNLNIWVKVDPCVKSITRNF